MLKARLARIMMDAALAALRAEYPNREVSYVDLNNLDATFKIKGEGHLRTQYLKMKISEPI